jgi:hypothetical protein
MSGVLGSQGLIEPLPIHLFAYTVQCLNNVLHLCGNEGARHPVGAIYFLFCVNLSPPTKMAECFQENLNTLDHLVFRKKIWLYNFVPQYSTPLYTFVE